MATLAFGGLVGYIADALRDSRLAAREERAHDRAAAREETEADRARQRARDAFEHEALAALQDSLISVMRTHALLLDKDRQALREHGSWGFQHNDDDGLQEASREAIVLTQRNRVRVYDAQIREDTSRLIALASSGVMSPTGVYDESALDEVSERFNEAGRLLVGLQERIGDRLREVA